MSQGSRSAKIEDRVAALEDKVQALEDKDKNALRNKESASAAFAFCFLVAVGVAKTLLTKFVFTHSPTPVAFSVLSCIATTIMLLPLIACSGGFRCLSLQQIYHFLPIWLAIGLDLGAQNVALAILSIALQQCLKATLPTLTVFVESAIKRKCFHPGIYITVISICTGPVLMAFDAPWDADSPVGSQLYGVIMMMVAMLGGAFKYVLCHATIREFRGEMGIPLFTFWVEIGIGLMLAPWAILNGEAALLIFTPQPMSAWALLWFTGAFGGVRVVAQFYFLAETSATSLAISGITMQALTITFGVVAFGDPVTQLLVWGVSLTLITSSVYVYLKTSKVLEPLPAAKKGLPMI